MVTQVIVVSDDTHLIPMELKLKASVLLSVRNSLVLTPTGQTSYSNMRGNYAGIGYTYMENVATLGVLLISLSVNNPTLLGLSAQPKHVGTPLTEPTLTDEQRAAGSYYTWDETAYQADNTTGWTLNT